MKQLDVLPTADWSHQILLAAEPTSTALARDFVCLHLVAHHLRHLVEDVRLVASELATNAVVHARTPFTVTLSSERGSVLLDFRDESIAAAVRSARPGLDLGGRGLVIVAMLSQDWGTSTDAHGSKSVWASFPNQPGASEG